MTTAFLPRIDVEAHLPRFVRALSTADAAAAPDLDPLLKELVRTHVSQLNGCAYCTDMHSKDGLAKGESTQRLIALPVWREAPYYTEAERSALALAEAMTRISHAGVDDEVYSAAAKQFAEPELAQLVALILVVNAWSRLGVTTRAWQPGSYAVEGE
jgi:AhpD family alkylhydroperoxidase